MKWMLSNDHTLMTTTVSVICVSMVKDVEVVLRAREAELHDQCLKMSENRSFVGAMATTTSMAAYLQPATVRPGPQSRGWKTMLATISR
jgi:hypothetical protein